MGKYHTGLTETYIVTRAVLLGGFRQTWVSAPQLDIHGCRTERAFGPVFSDTPISRED